jgi:hypothetical protein
LHGVVFDIFWQTEPAACAQPSLRHREPAFRLSFPMMIGAWHAEPLAAAPAFAQVGFGAAAFTRFASEG